MVGAKGTTKKESAKKRRNRPTAADEAHLMMSDDDRKLQPLKRQRGVKLGTNSMGANQGIKSTTTARNVGLSPLVPTYDVHQNTLVDNETSHDTPKAQISLLKLSPYVSSWTKVPKSSSEKVAVSTLSPYVSTWDQQPPKSVSEKLEMVQKPFSSKITLPLDYFYAQDVDDDADTPKAAVAGGSRASHVHAGENFPAGVIESVSSSPKEENHPSEEGELEMADSNAKENCAAGLQIKN